MEFIFTVVFRGLFFFTAAHFKIYSHSQTLIFPFSKPVQVLLGKKWKRSNRSSVVKAFHAKLPSHLKYAPVCQGSTCKQSAARSETPKAWLPCCKAVGRKKSARYYTNYKPCPFFPTSWQQLTTPSEVQLSYHYKTFHNSQKNKDTQKRILLLITWYISAHKKHQKYVYYSFQTFERMIWYFVASDCFANALECWKSDCWYTTKQQKASKKYPPH